MLDCQIRAVVLLVTADTSDHSLSFNEFLRLVSLKRREEPDEDNLMAVFRWPADTPGLP
jgi:hypothetical protein